MDTNRLIRLLQLVEVSRSLVHVVRKEMLRTFRMWHVSNTSMTVMLSYE